MVREKSLSTKTKHTKLRNPLSDLHMHIYLKKNEKVRRCNEVKKTYPRSRKAVERQKKRGKMGFESLN